MNQTNGINPKGYMLDTTVFNRVLDNTDISLEIFTKIRCFVTHIQADEISRTPKDLRRNLLNDVFITLNTTEMPTETFMLDYSRLDKARLGNGDVYQRILHHLNSIEKKGKNNIPDSLIAETAIKNNLTLITNDGYLNTVVTNLGGLVCSLEEFLIVINQSFI